MRRLVLLTLLVLRLIAVEPVPAPPHVGEVAYRKVFSDLSEWVVQPAGCASVKADEVEIRAIGAALHLDRATIDQLLELAHQTKVPTDAVNAALIRNPGVGALLRTLSRRRLSDEQLRAMLDIADQAQADRPRQARRHEPPAR